MRIFACSLALVALSQGTVSFDMTVTHDDQTPYPATFAVEDFEDVDAKAELFCKQHNVCDNKAMIVAHTHKLRGTPESAIALGEDMIEALKDPMFWHRIANVNKNLHIAVKPDPTQECHTAVVNETRIDEAKAAFAREGFAVLPNLVADELPELLLPMIKALKQHGWPPAFAYVFDELWHLACGLKPLVGPLFQDKPYRFVPKLRLSSSLSSGRDKPGAIDDKGRATAITFWMPLYQASIDNGALHVLPKSSDPNYNPKGKCHPLLHPEDLCSDGADGQGSASILESVRALPVGQCTYVAWAQGLYRWESRPTFAATESNKLQLAFDFELGEPEPPLPSLGARLKFIGEQLQATGTIGGHLKHVAHLLSAMTDVDVAAIEEAAVDTTIEENTEAAAEASQ